MVVKTAFQLCSQLIIKERSEEFEAFDEAK